MSTPSTPPNAPASRPLPPGWRWVKLGEICSVVSKGTTPTSVGHVFADVGVPFLRAEDVMNGPVDFTRVTYHISHETHAFLARSHLVPGDLLITIAGTLARVGYVPKDAPPLNCNQAVAFARVCRDVADVQFLELACRNADVIRPFLDQGVGGAIRNLSLAQLRDLAIPLPPLPEQKRIAGILKEQMAEVEKARAATEAQLEAAKALPAAYLREVFESEEAKKWPKKRIGDVARVQSGYAFKSEGFSDDGIRLLRNANVFQGYLAWDDVVRLPMDRRVEFADYELAEGDLILSLDRPVVKAGLKAARVTRSDLPALLLQRVGRFRLRGGVTADYLYAYLSTPTFLAAITRHDQSLGVPHVSPGQVEGVELPLPSISVQQRTTASLSEQSAEARRVMVGVEARLTEIDKLPAALLRKAFKGGL